MPNTVTSRVTKFELKENEGFVYEGYKGTVQIRDVRVTSTRSVLGHKYV